MEHNYEAIINKYLRHYNIKVVGYNKGNHGWANLSNNTLRIPKPKDVVSFTIALHEVGHLVTNQLKDCDWQREYLAAKFVFQEMRANRIHFPQQLKQAHINYLRHIICRSLRKKGTFETIPQEVWDFTKISKKYWREQINRGKKPHMYCPQNIKMKGFERWVDCKIQWYEPFKKLRENR